MSSRASGAAGFTITSDSVTTTLFDPAVDGPAKGIKIKVRSGTDILVSLLGITYGPPFAQGSTEQFGRLSSADGYQTFTAVDSEGGPMLGIVKAKLAAAGSATVDIIVDVGG